MISIGISVAINNYNGSLGQTIVNAFMARVAADSGTFEAQTCLLSTVNSLLLIDLA
jgi:hypothetical protein